MGIDKSERRIILNALHALREAPAEIVNAKVIFIKIEAKEL